MLADERARWRRSWRGASLYTDGVPDISQEVGHVTDWKRSFTHSLQSCWLFVIPLHFTCQTFSSSKRACHAKPVPDFRLRVARAAKPNTLYVGSWFKHSALLTGTTFLACIQTLDPPNAQQKIGSINIILLGQEKLPALDNEGLSPLRSFQT